MQITLNDIKAGPEVLEQKLSPRLNSNLPKHERFEIYREIAASIEKENSLGESESAPITAFVVGYVNHEAARSIDDPSMKRVLWGRALTQYTDVTRRWRKGEVVFYTHLSIGILLQNLEKDWEQAEEHYLIAYELSPERVEPLVRIAHYYQLKKQWPIAYLFTRIAKELFLGKEPSTARWGLDLGAYAKVLDLHKASCVNLNKMKEARESYNMLYQLTLDRPALFTPKVIESIHQQKDSFSKD